MLESGVKVSFVMHLHEFARGLHDAKNSNAVLLLAERLPDGTRTFRLIEGDPLQTSYGKDLYEAEFRCGAHTTDPRQRSRRPNSPAFAGGSLNSAGNVVEVLRCVDPHNADTTANHVDLVDAALNIKQRRSGRYV